MYQLPPQRSLEASSSSVSHVIPSTLWNPTVHCGIQYTQPLDHILRKGTPVQPPSYFLRFRLNLSFHPRLLYQSVTFLQASKPKPCIHLSSSPYLPPVLPISIFLISSLQYYPTSSTNHNTPHEISSAPP